MPISKTVTTPGGVTCAYHRCLSLKIDMVNQFAVMHLQSNVDEAAYIAGKPIVWNWDVNVPLPALTANVIVSAEQSLVTDSASPFSGGAVIADAGAALAGAQARKLASLSETCRNQIVAGFTSSALGSMHTYPARPQDQINLAGSILDSLLPGNAANWSTPFWCADAGGTWSQTVHTASQIQQVGRDGKAAVVAAITHNATLAQQVYAATTADAVAAILW